MMFPKNKISFLCCIAILLLSACSKDIYFKGSTSLKYSTDTLMFDTVFTRSSGNTYPISVTKIVSIKNNENAWVKANFRIGGGNSSPFRINIDGISGKLIQNLEIGPKDSVFIFVQCALLANNVINPALVLDSLMATVGTSTSKMILSAYGWDAHYYHDSVIPDQTKWTDTKKPYVIVGNAIVPYNSTFSIQEGVKVFASARTIIFVGGTFNINGSAANRVSITGDIPSYSSQTLPNQWGGIWYLPKGSGKITYANITNATVGIRIDSQSLGNNPALDLSQTKIQYCGQSCLIGVTSKIKAINCLFADAGSYSFLAFLGGDYDFNHCTFGRYYSYSNSQLGHFAITNTYRDDYGKLIKHAPFNLNLTNSIIYGYKEDEIEVDKVSNSPFTVNSITNILKTKDTEKLFGGSSNIFNQVPKFHDIENDHGNYSLDTLSPAIGKGTPSSPLNLVDILGKSRKSIPDIGAYEK